MSDFISPDRVPMKQLRWSSTHEFVVSVQTVGPQQEERLVERITELEAAHLWDEFSQDQRDAMVGLVRDALLRMARNVETWLPEAIVPKSDTAFGFWVLWKFGHLNEAVVLMRAKVDAEAQDRLSELQELADGSH